MIWGYILQGAQGHMHSVYLYNTKERTNLTEATGELVADGGCQHLLIEVPELNNHVIN